MELNDFQRRCEKTAIYPREAATSYCTLGLVSEAGEVAGKMKKYIRGDYGYDAMMLSVRSELGDVLWYVAMLAKEIGVPLESIAKSVLVKLENRQEAGTIKGSGDNR
jgi:NTP pyrophosphatase (non-canonical NTP hydrolase)